MTAMIERANAAFKKATDRRVFYDEDVAPAILRAALDLTEEEMEAIQKVTGSRWSNARAVIAALRKAGGVE